MQSHWFARQYCWFFGYLLCFVASCCHFQVFWSHLFPFFSILVFSNIHRMSFWIRPCLQIKMDTKNKLISIVTNSKCAQQTLFVGWVYFFTFWFFFETPNLIFSHKLKQNKLTTRLSLSSNKSKLETFKNIQYATEVLFQVDQQTTYIWIGWTFGLELPTINHFMFQALKLPQKAKRKSLIILVSGTCVLLVVEVCVILSVFVLEYKTFEISFSFLFVLFDLRLETTRSWAKTHVLMCSFPFISQFLGTKHNALAACFGTIHPLSSTYKPPHVFLDATSSVEGKRYNQSFCSCIVKLHYFRSTHFEEKSLKVCKQNSTKEISIMFFWSGHWHLRLTIFSWVLLGGLFSIHFLLAIHKFAPLCFYFTSFMVLVVFKGLFQFWKQQEDLNLTLSAQVVSHKTNHKCSEMLKNIDRKQYWCLLHGPRSTSSLIVISNKPIYQQK